MPTARIAPAGDPLVGIDEAALLMPAAGLLQAAHSAVWGWRPMQPDRRRSPRSPVVAAALFRPVDLLSRPSGEPFRAVVVDVSDGGLRFFHSRPITAVRLAVRLPGWKHSGVLEVRRCVEAGERFEYAGAFAVLMRQTNSEELTGAGRPAR